MSSREHMKEIIEDAVHLASEIVDEHFGTIEDIRQENTDSEEVGFQQEMKMRTYEIILTRLLEEKLRE